MVGIARGLTSSGWDVYDVALYVEGAPTASERVVRFVATRPLTLPANLQGSLAVAGTGAAGTVAFDLAVNGAALGSITFAASPAGTMPVVPSTALQPGDVLTLTAPASPDATLADIAFNLSFFR